MRPRSLLVLLAVVLALGAFVWFFERELPGSEEREEMAKLLLPRLETGEVTALAVEHGGDTVRLERVETAGEAETAEDEAEAADAAAGELPADVPPPAEWRIAAPERFAGARADRVAVESLVSALAALEKSRTLDDFDRAALGLDPPRARVTLERAEGEPIVLAVGADLPASSDMVVLREDRGEAHVVDRAILHDLTRAAGDWRARETFPGERDDVERVRLAGAGGEVVLERAGGGFRLTRPVADAADPAAVDELLGALTRLAAERF
ncbi:MAG TPA: DUF4340 domain-containing protein, partial [Thermoanaerobaculia bacterium]|nr:DUF4340 domain-containing protein [Thermoanaerobaculia bacterium]